MPVRVLELRSALGPGGGPEKTILLGAAQSDPNRYNVIVSYIRDRRDDRFNLDTRAAEMGVTFESIEENDSFDLRVIPKLHRVIRERQIDIVHAHDYKTDLLSLLVCPFTDAIPLSTAHGWAGFSRKERAYYTLDKWLLRRFPVVVTVSRLIGAELVRLGADPDQVRVIHNGVDTNVFRPDGNSRSQIREREGIPPDARVVGAVGRLSEEKRFDLFLEVIAASDVMGVLVGEGPARPALEEQAAALGLRDRIRFLGHRDDTKDCYRLFDVYLQTSDTEGIPNAVLEAMATGIPLVATAVGGTPEIVEGGVHGLLVEAGDLPAMIRSVRRVFDEPEATESRSVNARTHTEANLSFAGRMRRLEDIYDELVERYPRGQRRRFRWADRRSKGDD